MAIPNISISGLKTGKLDRASFIIFILVLFLTPIFFIPSVSIPFQIGKSVFILYGIVIAFALWCLGRLKDGVYAIPKTMLTLAALVLAAVYGLAAIFSSNQGISLAGYNFELGTLSFFLSSIVLFLIVPMIVQSQRDIFHAYTAVLASILVTGLYHIVRFIGGSDTLSFDMLVSTTSNLLGKWNDLGIFFGLGALFSVISLERGQLSRMMKLISYAILAISLFMLMAVNFSQVWIILAIMSLVYLIYELSFGKKSSYLGARLPYHALIVLAISVIFIFAGGKISNVLNTSLGINQIEVRPSWTATFDVAKESIKENPVFGAGPNRFSSEWLLNKPADINNTPFWNVDFNYGIGFLPSFVSTAGILGFLAILFFVGIYMYRAVRTLFQESSSSFPRYLVLSSLFASVYLWIFSIIYVPSAALWIVTMAMSGLFIASLREEGAMKMSSYSVVDKPAWSFVSVLITILLLIASLSFGYFVTMKLLGSVYFQKGIMGVNTTGNLDSGVQNITRAIELSPVDTYYQSLSEIYLAKINIVLNDNKLSQSDAQRQFQDNLSAAIASAQQAVNVDPTNYRNNLTLGRVFEAVVPLQIEGAYDGAKKAYEGALVLNPKSPEIYLILARLEVANKDNAAAKDYIGKALEKKGDYAEAIFLLSQIQIAENDVPNAVRSVEAVATLSPSDPGVFFQLGLLYYNQKTYQSAVLALERAVALNPQYANAKYFLGLSYYQTGQEDRALIQFTDLEITNPDNQEIKTVIANLKAGKAPLANQTSPERRSTAPVKETTTKEEI